MPGSLRLRWAVLSAVGLAAGLPAGILLLGPAEALFGMLLVVPVVFALTGALLGTSQWLAVRYLARPGRWIPSSALGLALGLTAGTLAIEIVGGWIAGGPVRLRTASTPALAAAFVALGAISGLALGAAQSLCLGARLGGAGRWAVANALALALGMSAGAVAAELVATHAGSPLWVLILSSVSAIAWALLTGRALERQALRAARAFRLSSG